VSLAPKINYTDCVPYSIHYFVLAKESERQEALSQSLLYDLQVENGELQRIIREQKMLNSELNLVIEKLREVREDECAQEIQPTTLLKKKCACQKKEVEPLSSSPSPKATQSYNIGETPRGEKTYRGYLLVQLRKRGHIVSGATATRVGLTMFFFLVTFLASKGWSTSGEDKRVNAWWYLKKKHITK
jgi:hypothetical protein